MSLRSMCVSVHEWSVTLEQMSKPEYALGSMLTYLPHFIDCCLNVRVRSFLPESALLDKMQADYNPD